MNTHRLDVISSFLTSMGINAYQAYRMTFAIAALLGALLAIFKEWW